jgi:7-cyano-7-deazaguanine synthase
MAKTIAVVSGGMDSATLLWRLRQKEKDEILAVSFDYGQKHMKELTHAHELCRDLFIPWTQVDLVDLARLFSASDSALVTDTKVPEGHYEDETMRQTVVPNRNSIMLNIAIGYAVAEKADRVATGVHAGDHAVYPDCRPMFISELSYLTHIACKGFIDPNFYVYAPYVHMTKTQIAEEGKELGVPYEKTWSCYKGGVIHCGRCSTCVERLEALTDAGVEDKTKYEDTEFWKQTLNRVQSSE